MEEVRNRRGEVIFVYSGELRNADLRNAYLDGANFVGADLQGASLQGADLRGADFRGANLLDASLLGANLVIADLGGADLRDSDLRGAHLLSASLQGADLRGADFRGANLLDADLQDIKTDGSSHDLAAYILLSAAGDDFNKRMFAGGVLISRDLTWEKFFIFNHPYRAWAIEVLSKVDGFDRKFREIGMVS